MGKQVITLGQLKEAIEKLKKLIDEDNASALHLSDFEGGLDGGTASTKEEEYLF